MRFGKYEILEELGRGGMGVVYKARDPIMGRVVALKTLTASLASDPDMLKRFYLEARAAGSLQHANIITIYDLGDAQGIPFIVMAFLEGETLEKKITRRDPLPLAQKLDSLLQCCRGLDFAHKHKVVHRDVKPANIFVKTDGGVVVLDFGIVRVVDPTSTSTLYQSGGTQGGKVIGTPEYMSPEQLSGEPVDHRSDIFSVGLVAYELLSCTKPFTSVIQKIKGDAPPALGELVPGIPPALERAVVRCLEQRPEDRFQSLEDFIGELEPLEQSLKRQMVGELVGQAQILYQQGEYTRAREKLRPISNLDSGNDLAKDLMAKIITELRRQEIVSKIERLVEEGGALLGRGQSTEAVRVLEEARKLDSRHTQVNTLLAEARKRIEREKILRASISALQTALNTGNLTVAEAELTKIRELDAEHPEVRNFQERIRQARLHERRLRIQQALLFPRHLLIQERFAEALEQLEELNREFPSESEIQELLATGRHKFQEQARRKEAEDQVKVIRKLIEEQRFDEAEESLNRLRSEPDQTSGLTELRESAQRQLEAARREQQLDRELAAIQALIRVENYDSAVRRAGILQVQYPDSAEARRLFDFALGLKQTVEQQKEIAALCRAIQALLDAGRNADAEHETVAALRRFPDNPALSNLLSAARQAQVQEAARLEQERIRRQIAQAITRVNDFLAARDYASASREVGELERTFPDRKEVRRLAELVRTSARADERARVQALCQTIQSLLDTGDLDRAVQEADEALHEFPGNLEVLAIRGSARRLQAERETQRQKEQAKAETRKSAEAELTAPPNIAMAGPQLEDQATRLLREPEAKHLDHSAAREVPQAADAGEAPSPSATRIFLEDQAVAGQSVGETPSLALPDLAGPMGPSEGEAQPTPARTDSPAVAVLTPAPAPRIEVERAAVPIWKRPLAIVAASLLMLGTIAVVYVFTRPAKPPKTKSQHVAESSGNTPPNSSPNTVAPATPIAPTPSTPPPAQPELSASQQRVERQVGEEFQRAVSNESLNGLTRLLSKVRSLAKENGPLADEMRDYRDRRIPDAMRLIKNGAPSPSPTAAPQAQHNPAASVSTQGQAAVSPSNQLSAPPPSTAQAAPQVSTPPSRPSGQQPPPTSSQANPGQAGSAVAGGAAVKTSSQGSSGQTTATEARLENPPPPPPLPKFPVHQPNVTVSNDDPGTWDAPWQATMPASYIRDGVHLSKKSLSEDINTQAAHLAQKKIEVRLLCAAGQDGRIRRCNIESESSSFADSVRMEVQTNWSFSRPMYINWKDSKKNRKNDDPVGVEGVGVVIEWTW